MTLQMQQAVRVNDLSVLSPSRWSSCIHIRMRNIHKKGAVYVCIFLMYIFLMYIFLMYIHEDVYVYSTFQHHVCEYIIVYVYIFVYVYVNLFCICIWTHVSIHIFRHVYIYIYILWIEEYIGNMYICVHTYKYIYIYMYICTCMYTYRHVYVYRGLRTAWCLSWLMAWLIHRQSYTCVL